MSRKIQLYKRAEVIGIRVSAYKPDVYSRTIYRFFRQVETKGIKNYFGPNSRIYTAVGIEEAEAFLSLKYANLHNQRPAPPISPK